MQSFVTVGLVSVLSSFVLILTFSIIVFRSQKKVEPELEPITDEEYPLPDIDAMPTLIVSLRRLRELTSSQVVKDNYEGVHGLHAVAVMNVLTAMLEIDEPASRTEIAPTMPVQEFHHVTRCLRQSGLISYDAEVRALTYGIRPEHSDALRELVLAESTAGTSLESRV